MNQTPDLELGSHLANTASALLLDLSSDLDKQQTQRPKSAILVPVSPSSLAWEYLDITSN